MSEPAELLAPNDMITLLRYQKIQAQLVTLQLQGDALAARGARLAKELNDRYGILPGDVIDDETGAIRRAVRPVDGA